jgi:hypothetical protein
MDDSESNRQRVEVTLPVMEFIDKIVNLVPPKGFKMIRHYGLYSRNQKKKAKEIMNGLQLYDKKREEMLNSVLNNVWKPICPKCGETMIPEECYYPT